MAHQRSMHAGRSGGMRVAHAGAFGGRRVHAAGSYRTFRGYGWRGGAVAGGVYYSGGNYSGGYGTPVYAGGYGYAHHGCWWYRRYDSYNMPSWCGVYRPGYVYGAVGPSYGYGYGYPTGGAWRGYHGHLAMRRGWSYPKAVTRVGHVQVTDIHGVSGGHGGARFAGVGGHSHGHIVH